jgi:predicted dehydrogenase/nucleoside-diphosphate-sugar epimerase
VSEQLRVAIVGCGAIAQAHARALARSTRARCTAVLDADRSRAAALAQAFCRDAAVVSATSELSRLSDAVIVAAPNAHHASLSVELLRAGLHVLCEKPLAIESSAAEGMLATATEHQRVLQCGFVRRFYPATELVRQALARRMVGTPVRFEVRESVTNWPMGRGSFERAVCGGGVFIDIAPHVIDELALWLGRVELVAYEDDAAGGVEASARARLRCVATDGRVVEGELHLSRAYPMTNRARIFCSDGRIEVDPHQHSSIRLVLGDPGAPYTLSAPPRDAFAAQLDTFLDAIAAGTPAASTAASAVENVRLVESAQRQRAALPEPWNGPLPVEPGPVACAGVRRWRRILVTGATGSVGSRLVERWALAGQLPQLRCLLRGYRSAARLRRFDVELAEADLLDRGALTDAARGCDAVVHLAVGDNAVEETETVVRVCRDLGIRRLVHMSSAAVYGRRLPRAIETRQEATPLSRTGEPYADAKAGAEAVVAAAGESLDAHLLRPHMVYGPGLRWSGELMTLLGDGRVPVVDDGGVINLIHVDDLVDAVAAALASDRGFGEAMFVTDGVPRPWSEYVLAHAALLDVDPPHVARDGVAGRRTMRQWLRDSVLPLAPVLRSSEFRAFVLTSPLMQATALRAWVAARGNKALGPHLARVRGGGSDGTAAVSGSFDETWVQMQLSEARLSAGRAAATIGFRARVDFAEGLRRTAAWFEAFGLMPRPS